MATFTLPYELRSLAWHNQKVVYRLLFQCAVETLKDFARNSPKLGHDIGMTAVLHTHSRQLEYHPHVHIVIPGGCLDRKKRIWRTLTGHYLFNAVNLAKVFRGRFIQALLDAGLKQPSNLPRKWITHCKSVGKGLPALTYLARYLYRGVISEKNIVHDDGQFVTFKYKNSTTWKMTLRKVKGVDFLWLILQHVLPKGFRRARDFGFLHGNAKRMLKIVQWALRAALTKRLIPAVRNKKPARKCPHCQKNMIVTGFIPPRWKSG